MVGIGSSEVLDLTLQVLLLVDATDSGVDDVFRFVLVLFFELAIDAEMITEVEHVVQSLPFASVSDALYSTMVCPSSKSRLRDVELVLDGSSGLVMGLRGLMLFGHL